MNNCTNIRNIIDEADRPDLLTSEATAHLSGCPRCRTFADERTKLRELLAPAVRVTVPANFDAVLNERLRELREKRSFWFSPAGFARMGAATAGLLAVLMAAQYGGMLNESPITNEIERASQDPSQVAIGVSRGAGPTLDDPPPPRPTIAAPVLSMAGGGLRRLTPNTSRAVRNAKRGDEAPYFIMRDQDRDSAIPYIKVSLGSQQQVLISSGKQQPRVSDVTY